MSKSMIKKFLIFVTLLSGMAMPITMADQGSIGDPGKAWEIPNDASRGQQIFTILDDSFGETSSYLYRSSFQAGVDTTDPTCASADDPKCSSVSYRFRAVLPQCANDSDVNCIENFGYLTADNVKSPAQFENYFPQVAQNQFVGNPTKNIPSGGSGSVYKIPSAAFTGGDEYYLAVTLLGGGDPQNSTAWTNGFSAYLFPVSKLSSNKITKTNENAGIAPITQTGSGNAVGTYVFEGPGLNTGTSCIVTSSKDQNCLERYSFPANKRFYMDVRLKSVPAGWLHGRMSTPEISITPKNGYSLISVSAAPVAVPVVYKMYEWAKMPELLKANYDVITGGYIPDHPVYVPGSGCGRSACDPDPAKRNVILAPNPYTKSAADQFMLWLPYINNTAQAMYGDWSVRTLDSNEAQGANRCFISGNAVTGIVTTNSSTYSAGPPSFNQATGTLDYQVAAPHYTSKGEVLKGNYDLVIRSDVARCVYGFSNAPISATVSVIGSDGNTSVASTVVNERNGWIHLAANGFTFSSPTVSVKLTQDKPASPQVVSTAQPTAPTQPTTTTKPVVKSSTISCIKGKTLKKVTGVNPKCPVGYKKK